jgi:hypothetical protein
MQFSLIEYIGITFRIINIYTYLTVIKPVLYEREMTHCGAVNCNHVSETAQTDLKSLIVLLLF